MDPVRIPERQLDLGSAAYFRVVTEVVPGNQVRVLPGFVYAGGYAVRDKFTGGAQTTAPFGPVLVAQQRYDLVYLDISGAASILAGTAVAFGSPVFDGAPGFNLGPAMPDQALPLAYVFVDETVSVVVDTADITQLGGQFQVGRDLEGYQIDKGFFGAAPTGTSDIVTAMFAGELPGGSISQAGVITLPPLNYTDLLDDNNDGLIHAATGSAIYGRLTEAAGVWTVNYFYTDATGAVASVVNIATDATVVPTDLRLVGVRKVYSRNDPARPLFDSSVARISDVVAGDIPTGTSVLQGKLRIEAGGSLTAADLALGTSDARTGAVRGRAGAGAVSGYQKIIRITGSGITVGLVEAGGELQFTLTAVGGAAPGGINQSAVASGGGTPNISVNPGFTPRLVFYMQNNGFDHSWGAGAGTAAALQQGISVSITPVSAGANALFGVVGNNGYVVTSFTSTNVTIAGPAVTQSEMFVLGGA